MPRVDGLEIARRLATHAAKPAVVILTTFDVDEYVYAALRHGAAGFLLKDTPPQDLLAAVRVAARGEAMISPRITKRLLASFAAGATETEARTKLETLTPREREVAVLIAQGLSNAELAKSLFLSESTIKVHVGHIKAKLSTANRTQIAILVHDAGLA